MPDDALLQSLPGAGPHLAPRLLAAFDQLLPSFTEAYQAAHPISPKRQRAPGGGRI
ncbi:MAG: hypothetical protein HC800_13135 [Phormidesmis sp. RL_2_1]|nr:hypothetical protein [Phormidesmis sp. RL_2_1]